MTIDSADIAIMEQEGTLAARIEHEIGHIIGCGYVAFLVIDVIGFEFRCVYVSAVREQTRRCRGEIWGWDTRCLGLFCPK